MSTTADEATVAGRRDPSRSAWAGPVGEAASGTGIDFETWFGRSMWLGILANWALAIPGIFWPNATLDLARQAPDLEHPIWPAFASPLLVLLSLFYIPGAIDLRRYRATAILSVLARLAGVVFFLRLWPGQYPAFGYLDLTFLLVQAPLLYLALRQQSRTEMRGDR